MNKNSIAAGQPEQVTVNDQKADNLPSAQVSANALVGSSLSVGQKVELMNGDYYYDGEIIALPDKNMSYYCCNFHCKELIKWQVRSLWLTDDEIKPVK